MGSTVKMTEDKKLNKRESWKTKQKQKNPRVSGTCETMTND